MCFRSFPNVWCATASQFRGTSVLKLFARYDIGRLELLSGEIAFIGDRVVRITRSEEVDLVSQKPNWTMHLVCAVLLSASLTWRWGLRPNGSRSLIMRQMARSTLPTLPSQAGRGVGVEHENCATRFAEVRPTPSS